jgi:RNA polymerase sigma-70 factor, ECF subfamily
MTRRERFELLFDAHYRDVQRFLLRRTDPPAAEELTNETFLICWRRLERVPDPALPWLFATARKCLANHRRAAARHARRERAAAHEERGTTARDPAERYAERDAVLRAFAQLPERDREILRLVAWEDLSPEEAARAAGISRTALSTRLHRARRRLEALLAAEPPGAEPDIGALRCPTET